MRFQRVAHDHAVVLADQRLERLGALVVANAMTDEARRGDAPHLPGLVLLAVEALASSSGRARSRDATGALEQRRVSEPKPSRQRVELIPESLRRHVEPVPAQDALLTRERDVIEVLVERDFDREVERVASALDGSLGARRRFDAPPQRQLYFCCLTLTTR